MLKEVLDKIWTPIYKRYGVAATVVVVVVLGGVAYAVFDSVQDLVDTLREFFVQVLSFIAGLSVGSILGWIVARWRWEKQNLESDDSDSSPPSSSGANVVAAFAAAALLAFAVGFATVPANAATHLPDCKKDAGGLVDDSINWKTVTAADMQAMIDDGAYVNATDKYGQTPLHAAAGLGKAKVIPVLLKAGADVNAKEKTGFTPLHAAANNGQAKIISILVQAGADVNAKSDGGFTPLHAAAFFGKAEVISVLVKAGAYVNPEDSLGDTPLDLAKWKKNWNTAKELEDAGAK